MGEYVEKDVLLSRIAERQAEIDRRTHPFSFNLLAAFAHIVGPLPTADVTPVVHGEWEEKFFTNDRQRVCSVCHCTVRQPSYDKGETALFKYCPNCGAKMDGGERDG